MPVRPLIPAVALVLGFALACASPPEPSAAPPVPAEPAPSAPASTGELRYDGLYASPGEQSTTYVRFYEDGHVSSIGSTGNAEQVAAWLGRSHEGSCQGTYERDGASVSFACASAAGTVEHTGRLEDGVLHLHWKSQINGAEGDGVHTFVGVAFGAE